MWIVRAGYRISLKFRLWPESCAIGSGDVSSWSSCHDICLTSKSSDLLTVNGVLVFWAISGTQIFLSKLTLMMTYGHQLQVVFSSLIMPSTHANKLIFSQSVGALSGLVLLVTSQMSLTPLLPWLTFLPNFSPCIERRHCHLTRWLAIDGFRPLPIP